MFLVAITGGDAFSPAAAVPHAWVSYSGSSPLGTPGFFIGGRTGDDPGKLSDSMLVTDFLWISGTQGVSGQAATDSGLIELSAFIADDNPPNLALVLGATGEQFGTFVFSDANNPGATGSILVAMDIHYTGTASANTSGTIGGYLWNTMSPRGLQVNAPASDTSYDGVFSRNWFVDLGVPVDVFWQMGTSVSDKGSGGSLDFSYTASFRAGPGIALTVSSDGGFRQGFASAPEPATLALLLLGAAAFVRRGPGRVPRL